MSQGFLPSIVTIALSVGIYYLWSIYLNKNDTVGIVLGIAAAILTSAIFTKFKKR